MTVFSGENLPSLVLNVVWKLLTFVSISCSHNTSSQPWVQINSENCWMPDSGSGLVTTGFFTRFLLLLIVIGGNSITLWSLSLPSLSSSHWSGAKHSGGCYSVCKSVIKVSKMADWRVAEVMICRRGPYASNILSILIRFRSQAIK